MKTVYNGKCPCGCEARVKIKEIDKDDWVSMYGNHMLEIQPGYAIEHEVIITKDMLEVLNG